jgi:hypothetical protein
MSRLARIGIVVVAAVVALTSCGLGDDDTIDLIPADEILFGLDQTTTTSTTTTTLPPEPPVDPLPTTTTLSPVQTAPVEVYFVIGLDRLQRQTLQFSFPIEPLQVLAQLEEGPPADVGVGLRTALRPNLTAGIESADGIATIDLRGSVINRTSSRDQNLAIAQLVLTVGRLPGVGQVRFTLDGEPTPIPVPPTYTLSEPGEPLSYEAFSVLISSSDPPPTVVPTTVPSPPTTAPPPVVTDPADDPTDAEPIEPIEPIEPGETDETGEQDDERVEPDDGRPDESGQ